MRNEEEKRCPLCAEEMDWTDQQLNPCKCGYEVCVWCWHHIMDMAEKDATKGRCPACRTPYNKDKIVGLETNFERVAANSSSRKQKLSKAKPISNEGRKDLSNVRVIQRKMAYIIGLPLDLGDEELLQQKQYFGQYGKVTKVSLSRTAGGAVQQFINDTCSVYITYSNEEEAVTCIQSVHGYVLDGRLLRASFGTAKYCHAWLRNMPCNNPTCLYLHTLGAEEDSFGKDEAAAVHTRNRVQKIVGNTQYLHGRSGSTLPPPVIEQLSMSAEESACNNDLKEVASDDHQEKDAPVRLSKHPATFVDIVGGSSSEGSNKDIEQADLDRDDISIGAKEQSTFDDERERLKDFVGSSHMVSFVPSSAHISSVTNDGYNEKFQSLTKSDRIYRGSNSFSNEEIVEHLRRLDHDENSADLESSIISDILSLDLGGSDNSAIPQRVAGLFEARHGSLRNFNKDQSRFSFANEGQQIDNIGQDLDFSVLQDSSANNDCLYKSQHHASTAQNLTPPGFSIPSKPPPGFFPACVRTAQAVAASSGRYIRVSPYNHCRSLLSNSSDDLIDPVIMAGGDKSPTNVLTNSLTSSFSSRCSSSFDENTKYWQFMQPQSGPSSAINHHQEPRFSLAATRQHHTQFPSYQDDLYGGFASGLADVRNQSYNPSLFTQQQYSQQPNYGSAYQQLNQEAQPHDPRSEVERYGLDSFLAGYGDYRFQMPTSGRVFGM